MILAKKQKLYAMNATIDTNLLAQFPVLQRKVNGQPLVLLDGPAGTQVPLSVIDAISHYYKNSNANSHGAFITTRETDIVLDETRAAVAALLGAEGAHNISFGQNMTTLNFSLSKAIGRKLQPGDEILITQLDHESNRGPWLALRDKGIIVREIPILENGTLAMKHMRDMINENTRLVAMGMASNFTGAVNDFQEVRKLTYEKGAWLLLDAVHYAPHFSIDVGEIGCDFLLCSAYKFYGPHVGLLYSKTGMLDQMPTDRLRTAYQMAPYKIETGTLNHAALAGVLAAIRFMAEQGKGETLRDQLITAFETITPHEERLAKKLYAYLDSTEKFNVIGPDFGEGERAPTLSFVTEGMTAKQVCEYLAENNICAWSGHFYAQKAAEVLGLQELGGVTRMGMSIYTTDADIEKTIAVLEKL